MIKGRLRPLNPKSEWEIHQVCPIRSFSLSRPHTTLSDKKLGRGANQRLLARDIKEFREIKEFRTVDLDTLKSLNSLSSLNSLKPIQKSPPLRVDFLLLMFGEVVMRTTLHPQPPKH